MIYRLVFLSAFASAECFSDPLSLDKAALPTFLIGEPYGDVRGKLIGEGWSPVLSPDADICMEGDVRCANRPERRHALVLVLPLANLSGVKMAII